MADIIHFTKTEKQIDPINYNLDVNLYPDDLHFTLTRINTDNQSLLKIAAELEKIAHIIRSDVIIRNKA